MYRYKKITAFALSTMLCISCIPCAVHAEENSGGTAVSENGEETVVSGDYTYSPLDSETATIVTCNSTEKIIDVPNEIDGYRITELYKTAFADVPAEIINLPASIEYISADNPFLQCGNLKEINVDPENENYCSSDGILYSKDMKSLIHYPKAKEEESFSVPEGIETIGTGGIYETQLKSISFPKSLAVLKRHSIGFNENITSVDLSNTALTEIGIMAFVNCTSLSEVKLPSTLEAILLGAFLDCSSLAEIELPENLYSIGQSAFAGTALTEIRIPSTVEEIGYSAFGYDENDEPVENFTIIGESGSSAEKYASDSDAEYNYYNNFSFITTETADARDAYIALNPTLSSDGNYEYSVNENDEGILVTCVSADVILKVPDEIDGHRITSIYSGAFLACSPDEIIIPEGIVSVGDDCFPETVRKISFPASCSEIQGDEPFIYCYSLEEIDVTEGNQAYSSENGVLYNADKSAVIAYPMAKKDTSYTAPDSLKTVNLSAFYQAVNLKSADISTAERIEPFAFENCTSLETLKLSKELNFVGNYAVYNCPSLQSVRLYDKLETIGDYAFGYLYDETAVPDQTTGELQKEIVKEDFKIYAEKDTLAYQYAKACGFETVENTVDVSGKNVDKNFLYFLYGACGAVIIAVIGIITGKSVKRKKSGGSKR